MRIAIVITVLFGICPPVDATTVRGTIRDECGVPLAIAHVFLDSQDEPAASAVDGEYSLEVTTPGLHELTFTSPGRARLQPVVYVARDNARDTIVIDVTMPLPEWRFRARDVGFSSSRHGRPIGGRQAMPLRPLPPLPPPPALREPYTATTIATGDTTWFVVTVHEWRDSRGHSSWIRYPSVRRHDGFGFKDREYVYWMRSRRGDTVTLSWSPLEDLLIENRCPGAEARVDITPAWAERVQEMEGLVGDAFARWHAATLSERSGRRMSALLDSLLRPVRQELTTLAGSDPDTRVRELASARLLSVLDYDRSNNESAYRVIRRELDASSPALAVATRELIHHIDSIAPDAPQRFLWRAAESLADADERASLLLAWYADVNGSDRALAAQLYARIVDSFARQAIVAYDLTNDFEPLDTLHGIGDTFPRFTVRTLDSRSLKVGGASGGYVLVELWSPSESRSLAERDLMCDVARQYRDRGLRVVSIAIDGERADVRRAPGQDACPCEQAWVAPSLRPPILARLDLTVLPKRYLLAPDGTIVTLELPLSGGLIMDELEGYLPND